MVELRKRAPRPEPAAKKARSSTPSSVGSKPTGVSKRKAPAKKSDLQPSVQDEAVEKQTTIEKAPSVEPDAASTAKPSASGSAKLPLSEDSIGQKVSSISAKDVQLHTGDDVTFDGLLEKADKGLVVFTYPKASTPGCTTQACAFRDNYDDITAKGWSVYGLSQDSTKANTGFVTKQKLNYELLCDGSGELVKALGFSKGGKGTLRGVVVVDKEGVVQAWSQSGPAKTLEVVREYLGL